LVAILGGLVTATAAISPAIAAGAPGTAIRPPAKTISIPPGWSTEEKKFIKDVGSAVLRNQDALSDFRGWIAKQRGFATSGYVGAIDDLPRKGMAVMWHGPRTPLLTAIIREGLRRGIRVGVQRRKYGLQQLRSAMAATWAQAAAGKWAGFTISGLSGLGVVENGITAYGSYTPGPAANRAPLVRSLETTEAGIPVHLVPGYTRNLDTSRIADVSPFNAGDFMGYPFEVTPVQLPDACSTGFSIVSGGFNLATTARHCAEPEYSSWSVYAAGNYPGPANQQYVNSSTTSTDGGARVMNSAGSPLMFNTGPQSTTTLQVIGFFNPALRDLLCTEGGNSGQHCDLVVTDMLYSWDDTYGHFETIVADAQADTGQGFASMSGDSGGPVMSLSGTSVGQVKAAGMIQGTVDGLTSCGASHNYFTVGPPLNMTCGKRVAFSSMVTIVKHIPGGACLLAVQGPVCP
jgi:hypothetical protein